MCFGDIDHKTLMRETEDRLATLPDRARDGVLRGWLSGLGDAIRTVLEGIKAGDRRNPAQAPQPIPVRVDRP